MPQKQKIKSTKYVEGLWPRHEHVEGMWPQYELASWYTFPFQLKKMKIQSNLRLRSPLLSDRITIVGTSRKQPPLVRYRDHLL